MEKMMMLRSVYKAACFGSSRFAATTVTNLSPQLGYRSFSSVSSVSAFDSARSVLSGGSSSFAVRLGSMRCFSVTVSQVPLIKDPEMQKSFKDFMAAKPDELPAEEREIQKLFKDFMGASSDELPGSVEQNAKKDNVAYLPVIEDPEIQNAFKDLIAASWDKLHHSVVRGATNALSKNTDDKAGLEALKNVFRAAEAVEEFSGIVMSMKMELDDSIGLNGEDVKPLSDEFANALETVYQRYKTYLAEFGPEETYLRKKVETELGSKLIYLKMRCSGLPSEWAKVTVLGTSGLSGSYVEQRA